MVSHNPNREIPGLGRAQQTTNTVYRCGPDTWHTGSGKRLILPVWIFTGSFSRAISSDHIKADKPANQILLGHHTPNPPVKISPADESSGHGEAIYTGSLHNDKQTNKHGDYTGCKILRLPLRRQRTDNCFKLYTFFTLVHNSVCTDSNEPNISVGF